ncbi:hypothetical protein [Nonomuraea dietziae]|uniref:hypothetical protein n=1 Tax=Nonomuraea dietziae TaxID=65515 RepID=UPI003444DF1D
MRIIAPIILLAASTAGCAGSQAAAPPTVPRENPPTTTSPASATPSTPAPAEIGAAQDNRGENYLGKVTALRIRQPLRTLVSGTGKAGHEYLAIEAKVCVVENSRAEKISVSWQPWAVAMADDTVATPLGSWSSEWFDVPLYPQDRIVRTGSCVRGWIPFEVPKGAKPRTVSYQPADGDTLDWQVS